MIFDDSIPIKDIAREAGYFIDKKGNWIPVEFSFYHDYEAEELDLDYIDCVVDDDDYDEEMDDWEG